MNLPLLMVSAFMVGLLVFAVKKLYHRITGKEITGKVKLLVMGIITVKAFTPTYTVWTIVFYSVAFYGIQIATDLNIIKPIWNGLFGKE
jgi:FtsH-binding integral membrane protein